MTTQSHPMHPQHTPTPWHVSPLDSSRYMVCHDDGFVIATVSPEGNRTLANAAFIVRACNSHAQLVAALERLAAAGEKYGWDVSEARAALASAQS